MDIRVLRYFLTVAREESFSKAAEVLYLSQPTLSRQIREMEEELGVQLLIRTNRNVQLTPEGQRLRRRAQEIVDLMDKTQDEFQHLDDEVSGQITIGAGETQIMREIAKVAIPLQREHPGIRFNLYSANADDVAEKLDKGLLDFGLMFEPYDLHRYETLLLPFSDTIGFLMRTDHPLAQKDSVRMEDVERKPFMELPSDSLAGFKHHHGPPNGIKPENIAAVYLRRAAKANIPPVSADNLRGKVDRGPYLGIWNFILGKPKISAHHITCQEVSSLHMTPAICLTQNSDCRAGRIGSKRFRLIVWSGTQAQPASLYCSIGRGEGGTLRGKGTEHNDQKKQSKPFSFHDMRLKPAAASFRTEKQNKQRMKSIHLIFSILSRQSRNVKGCMKKE